MGATRPPLSQLERLGWNLREISRRIWPPRNVLDACNYEQVLFLSDTITLEPGRSKDKLASQAKLHAYNPNT